VPVFVMASGALVIPRAMESGAADFYRRRLGRILPAAVFWIAVYLVFAAVFKEGVSDPAGVLQALMSGTPYNHLYFLFLILGLYAVTPVLARALVGTSPQFVWGVALGALALNVLAEHLNRLIGVAGTPNAVTWWIPFVGYFLIGYAISTTQLRPRPALAVAALILAFAIPSVSAYLAATALPGLKEYVRDYLGLPVVAAALLAFLGFRATIGRVGPAAAARWRHLARLTFGVYLIHLIFAVALLHYGAINGSELLPTIAAFGATLVLSFAAVEIWSRIPVARRLVGL
jgi:surface polysaccharide O-acyltransferase-like enzyme